MNLSTLLLFSFLVTRIVAIGICEFAQSTRDTQIDRHACASSHVKKYSTIEPTTESTTGKASTSEQTTLQICGKWVSIWNHLYMIPEGTNEEDFEISRSFCLSCGGDVVIFNTSDLLGELEELIAILGSSKSNFWLGIQRNVTQREFFEWLDDRPFSTEDSAWRDGQPNDNPGIQNCVATFRSDVWQLQDKRCSDRYDVICQKSLESLEFERFESYHNLR